MNYKETLEYLYNSTPVFETVGASAYKEGLHNTITLNEYFGYPHKRYKTIHVAGTNGKGSVSHSIASILQEEGYRVGLYTSPHLLDFRERIRINGMPVSEEYVIDFVEENRFFFEPLHPSFFELTTSMAFKAFADSMVDIAVIEVGLGGRLDCTNIISPILSVITNISFDHTQFLGDTLEKIAREKAGIIKKSVPVVVGEVSESVKKVFEDVVREKGTKIYFTQENGEEMFDFQLRGNYQKNNLKTILLASDILEKKKIITQSSSVKKGLIHVCENTGLQGRWQILNESPLVICDTGHNVAAWEYLSRQIKEIDCQNLRIIFGMVDDKDLDGVISLLPKNAEYYFTQANNKRAISSIEIKRKAEEKNLNGKAYQNVKEAYIAALSETEKDDFIFIGGSNYIVSDLLLFLS